MITISAKSEKKGHKLEPIKLDAYKPLREVVSEALRQAIKDGLLQPGERLMEIQLADELGVSRTPIREAIRKLELEGFVVMVPRRGAYVADISLKDVAQVFEMLLTCFGDADFADGHAQALHEVDGVCVGAVGGAEAGHGDSDDASTVEPEAVEGMNADEEGQRGIQAAADAEDNGLGMGVGDAFAQSFRLHAEDFFTPRAQFFSTGDEGKRIDGSVEFKLAV